MHKIKSQSEALDLVNNPNHCPDLCNTIRSINPNQDLLEASRAQCDVTTGIVHAYSNTQGREWHLEASRAQDVAPASHQHTGSIYRSSS